MSHKYFVEFDVEDSGDYGQNDGDYRQNHDDGYHGGWIVLRHLYIKHFLSISHSIEGSAGVRGSLVGFERHAARSSRRWRNKIIGAIDFFIALWWKKDADLYKLNNIKTIF